MVISGARLGVASERIPEPNHCIPLVPYHHSTGLAFPTTCSYKLIGRRVTVQSSCLYKQSDVTFLLTFVFFRPLNFVVYMITDNLDKQFIIYNVFTYLLCFRLIDVHQTALRTNFHKKITKKAKLHQCFEWSMVRMVYTWYEQSMVRIVQ